MKDFDEKDLQIIDGIQSLLHNHLTKAIDTGMEKLKPDFNIAEILPIALSQFIYRELFILSDYTKIPIDKWNNLFIELLNRAVKNNFDLYKLNMDIKENENETN